MNKAIIVDHLSKTGELDDISFTIQKGEFVGIVGSRGSGKTSILKSISGLLKPTSGFVSVLGYDPFLKVDSFLSQISYINNQTNQLLKKIPAIDMLQITQAIYGIGTREFNKNLSEIAQYVSDPNLLDSLVYKPKVVILDDPNIELEPLYKYNEQNESTIILATGKIDSLINLVRRIIIINEGRVLFDGAIDEVITKYATEKSIKVRLSSEVRVKEINEIATVKNYTFPHLTLSAPRSVVVFTAAELMQSFPIVSLSIEELSIEEIIKNIKV